MGDLLTHNGNTPISPVAIGNPFNYGTWIYMWEQERPILGRSFYNLTSTGFPICILSGVTAQSIARICTPFS